MWLSQSGDSLFIDFYWSHLSEISVLECSRITFGEFLFISQSKMSPSPTRNSFDRFVYSIKCAISISSIYTSPESNPNILSRVLLRLWLRLLGPCPCSFLLLLVWFMPSTRKSGFHSWLFDIKMGTCPKLWDFLTNTTSFICRVMYEFSW